MLDVFLDRCNVSHIDSRCQFVLEVFHKVSFMDFAPLTTLGSFKSTTRANLSDSLLHICNIVINFLLCVFDVLYDVFPCECRFVLSFMFP